MVDIKYWYRGDLAKFDLGSPVFDLRAYRVIQNNEDGLSKVSTGLTVEVPLGYALVVNGLTSYAYDKRISNQVVVYDAGLHEIYVNFYHVDVAFIVNEGDVIGEGRLVQLNDINWIVQE